MQEQINDLKAKAFDIIAQQTALNGEYSAKMSELNDVLQGLNSEIIKLSKKDEPKTRKKTK